MSKQLEDVKKHLRQSIETLEGNISQYVKNPGRDFTRRRSWTFEKIIEFLLTLGSNSIALERVKFFKDLDHEPSQSALNQQRQKLNEAAFPALFATFNQFEQDCKTFKGYRLFGVDGTAINSHLDDNDPDTHFPNGQPNKAYNQLHLDAVHDLENDVFLEASITGRRQMDERQSLSDFIDDGIFPEKSIITTDRGYECHRLIVAFNQKNLKFVMRVKAPDSGTSILKNLDLPKAQAFDKQISYGLSRRQDKQTKANPKIKYLPHHANFPYLPIGSKAVFPITFRVVALERAGHWYYLITNLDKDFTANDLTNIYTKRWEIETAFDKFKNTLGVNILHSKRKDFVIQEIWSRLIMYNFTSFSLATITIPQKQRKYPYKACFKHALYLLKDFFRGLSPPERVVRKIKKNLIPIRVSRSHKVNPKNKGFTPFNPRIA